MTDITLFPMTVLAIFTAIEPKTVMTCEYDAGDFFELAEGSTTTSGDDSCAFSSAIT